MKPTLCPLQCSNVCMCVPGWRQQRLTCPPAPAACSRGCVGERLRRSGLLRDEGIFMKASKIRRVRAVEGLEDKIVCSLMQLWVFFLCFCAVKPRSKTSLLFTVILNTLLLVITSRKQTIDHLRTYWIIPRIRVKSWADLRRAPASAALLSVWRR